MKGQKGFTLIELLVVIAIIAILAAVVLVALGNARDQATESSRQADANSIMTGVELYKNAGDGAPPTTAEGVAELVDEYLARVPEAVTDGYITYTGVANDYSICVEDAGNTNYNFKCQNGQCWEFTAQATCAIDDPS